MRQRSLLFACCLAVFSLCTATYAAQTSPIPSRPKLLPVQQEVALALSAGPSTIRAGAGVYALEQQGYVQVRTSTNGFTCIVNRDHPLNVKPTCYDAEGSATIVPVDLEFGKLLMQGTPVAEIKHTIMEGFRSGLYRSPRRPGVAYMLSDQNLNYNAATGHVDRFPPHVMFYAPNLTNKDIGSDGTFSPGMPSIAYQGPQGFMIVVMPTNAPMPAHHAH